MSEDAYYPLSELRVDTRTPNIARAWNFMVGGKDNFEADRAAAQRLFAVCPSIKKAAPASRAFLKRAVRYLAGQEHIRQFLDVGTGLPTAGNTHEVAQGTARDCKVVYVDNDPVVLNHARALLTSTDEGTTSYIEADARDPDAILAAASQTLDFSQPVAIVMVDLLNFIDDDNTVRNSLTTLTKAIAPGSYLVIMHPASDLDPDLLQAERLWNQVSPQRTKVRRRDQVAEFFQGLELIDPGLVTVAEWRPDDGDAEYDIVIPLYGAVARKS
jgi:O-methyltransferase involved in polyketide biosynthesis